MPPRKPPPGNPDWVEWVEQLAQEADDKGSKASNSYKRAAQSLRSNPIPMTDPEQARQLSGVGDVTIKYLKRRIEKQAKESGLPVPERLSPPKRSRAPPTAGSTTKKRTREEEEREADSIREIRRLKAMGLPLDSLAAQPPPQRQAQGLGFQAHPDGAFADLPREGEEPEPATEGGGGGGGGKKSKAREYIPKKRSGAYAILIALYKNASYDEHSPSTLKTKIVQDAREWSDASFDSGSANRDGQRREGQSFTYTAWSGMATLTQKGFVKAENTKPARFHLTEPGYLLAERVAESVGIPRHVYVPSSSSQGGGGGHPSSSGDYYSRRGGGGGGQHPSSSSGSASGLTNSTAAAVAAFSGRGQTLGVRPGNLHSNVFRRKSPTPPLFLDEPDDVGFPSGTRRGERVEEADDQDIMFEQDLRKAMELSRRESRGAGDGQDPVARIARETAMRTSGAGPSASTIGGGGAGGFRPSGTTGSVGLNGRKAALGAYASSSRAASSSVNQGPSIANVDGAFGYFYLDENDSRTKRRDEAEVSQSEDHAELLYRIEYRVAQDLHAIVRGLVKPATLSRPKPLAGGKTKSAYIKARVSNEVAPGFPESSFVGVNTVKEKPAPSEDPVSALLAGYKDAGPRKSKDAMYQPPPEVRRLGSGAAPPFDPFAPVNHTLPIASTSKRPLPVDPPPRSTSAVDESTSKSRPRPPRSALDSHLLHSTSSPSFERLTTSQNPLQACFDPLPGGGGQLPNETTIINRHPLDPVQDFSSSSASTPFTFPTEFNPVVWPRGTFKVYLVVDTREGTREAGKRIELYEKLKRLGIPVDKKMLPLGDMIWVARRVDPRTGESIEGGGREKDVVLDAIVERKRLDDLVSSIVDGRYLGQKIRLKDSGISHRIYLIEKYGETTQNASFGKAIWTCKSQLQVNDGFYVHESANMEDTINYLQKRTRIMAELYEDEEIRMIPDELIERRSYLAFQHHLRSTRPLERYLVSYPMFAELNQTDSTLTLRVSWASMVQRIKGMSAEKAVQFLKRWETMANFYDEAREWEVQVDEENRKLDQVEANQTEGGKGKKKQAKRRRKEDFVVSNLEDVGTRGIKGKLGEKIWELFMTKGEKYTS